jgi:adenosylcobinamide-GDP ribazoletransferase
MAEEHEIEKPRTGRGLFQSGGSWLLAPPLAALQFLTVVPPIVRRPFTPVEMGRAVGYFPLVGALLGGVLVGLNWSLAHIFPQAVSVVLLLTAWVAGTGALHLDGFLDTCDGLFGGHTPESRLDIMHDERVGAFGMAGGVLLLLLKIAAMAVAPRRAMALLLAPILGRWGMTLAVTIFPYARPEGLGRAMKDHAGWGQIVVATASALAVAWLAGGWPGVAAMALAGVVTWATARLALARLPGLTGDVYGTICETVEVVVLLLFATGLTL